MFGDSHTDGNGDIQYNIYGGQMETPVTMIHPYLAKPCFVFGSASGGSGIIAPGTCGVTYTNRFYNDVFGTNTLAKPDILIYEGSNDHLLSLSDTNAFALGIRYICQTITTNMVGSNVLMEFGPLQCQLNSFDGGEIYERDQIKSNCTYYGFNFFDWLGGAKNASDVNRGPVNSNTFSLYMQSDGHLTYAGKLWRSAMIASNINNSVIGIMK
jgi:hypothetical protein